MTKVRLSDLSHFSDKQQEAAGLVSKFKYVLYGGAMGGGKSYWIRWMLITLLLKWAKKGHRNVTVGLFCEDYPALKDRHISKLSKEFPKWLGEFHSDHKEYGKSYILKPEYGGGVICFRNLDDPSKYQSAEFACIAIDELTKNSEDVFDDLRTRLRWPNLEQVKFISATNPGGIGHAWVKKRFIDMDHDEHELEADQFSYVQALATDNPHLSESYVQSLSGLPEEKRKAFLEGNWDIFKGQFFTEWRKDLHTCKPFDIPENWPKFVCGDYGYRAPSAVYWCAVDEDGGVWVYRELYRTQMTYEELSLEIISMTLPNEKIDYWVFDPAIWAKKDSPVSGSDIMRKTYQDNTQGSIRLIRGMNDRVIGWQALREKMKPFKKATETTCLFKVFDTCEELIRTLPSLVYDTRSSAKRGEDLDSDGDDHAADAIRYGIMSRPKNAEKLPDNNSYARISKKGYDVATGLYS